MLTVKIDRRCDPSDPIADNGGGKLYHGGAPDKRDPNLNTATSPESAPRMRARRRQRPPEQAIQSLPARVAGACIPSKPVLREDQRLAEQVVASKPATV
ncbi:hypothetical protein ACNKU7_07565 [Microbulbifer sp. SA54]|uniref:hypothetical protein n=1 Tax=Microbulbifer sp. SA54 TaxID=3401577 RepID=UPI003AAF6E24